MADQKVTFATWVSYEKRVFRHAWEEISAASLWRSVGTALITLPLQYWAGLKPRKDTLEMLGFSIGAGLIVFLSELAFRRLRAPAAVLHEIELKAQELEAEKNKRCAVKVVPKKFVVAHDLKAFTTKFDIYTMSPKAEEFTFGLGPATLVFACHNITETPIILQRALLLHADTGKQGMQFSVSNRIPAHDSADITVEFDSNPNDFRQPPAWPGLLVVETVSNQKFSSEPFNFGELVDAK